MERPQCDLLIRPTAIHHLLPDRLNRARDRHSPVA